MTCAEESNLTRGERELVGIAVSSLAGCVYCVITHCALHRLSTNRPHLAEQVCRDQSPTSRSCCYERRDFDRCHRRAAPRLRTTNAVLTDGAAWALSQLRRDETDAVVSDRALAPNKPLSHPEFSFSCGNEPLEARLNASSRNFGKAWV